MVRHTWSTLPVRIQKNKKNAKDADDRYYCTDSKGIVTYEGMEKKSEK